MHPIILTARAFAEKAHHKQTRKYTGDPYFDHCKEVAQIVEEHGGTVAQIAAAYLHDVVEDTEYDELHLSAMFGPDVSGLVAWLTDQSKPEDGNRAARKKIDRDHIAEAPAAAQTIKLADLISNTQTIVQYDPAFAKVYLQEKMLLLSVLSRGHRGLWMQAWVMARDGLAKLEHDALDKALSR